MIVTPETWYWGAGNRWAFRNMRRLFPTARIGRGTGPVATLPSRIRAIDAIAFHDPSSDAHLTLGDLAGRTWLDGLLILKDGEIVAERYFNGMMPDEPHLLMSVSKSIAGAVTGIVVERGQLDLAGLVTDYLPELAGTAYDGATVRQVLDMQVSIDFDYDTASPDSDIHRMDESVGWVSRRPHAANGIKAFITTLTRKLGAHGARFLYLSQNTSVLTWILERATGLEFPALLQRELWEKLGAEHDTAMVLDGFQQSYSPAGLSITLRDLGRFGQMMLQNGVYNGQRIIPEEWIRDIRAAGSPEAWTGAVVNRCRDSFAGFAAGSYRSYWYVSEPGKDRYIALGLGSQILVIDPTANMVAVAFSSPPSAADGEAASVTQYHAIAAVIAALSGA